MHQLTAVYLIAEECDKDVVWRLSYPSITDKRRSYIRHKLRCDFDITNCFNFYHFDDRWFYGRSFLSTTCDTKKWFLFLETSEFNPEKYKSLAEVLCAVFAKTGDLKSLMHTYLNAFIDGRVSFEKLTFIAENCEQKKMMSMNCPFKQIITMFGVDIILVYTALILKQRIAVYHHTNENLLQFVTSLPCFVWHRLNWDQILYPTVNVNSKEDMNEIRCHNHFIAGFTNSNIESRTDLYDVFVNLAAVEITVANHAKEIFAMTKTHKEIAMFMKRLSENESTTDLDVIKQVSLKTLELIDNLKSLCSNGEYGDALSKTALEEKKLGTALESFLKRLAVAENLKLT
ncbi:protein FAM45A-like isoform X1 [Leptotrombidium deliense]|uniref:Protein FAM45A-like isoform X1 n=1 Tax=Leptotrombidium deliense TaxID=299467 RepID=A0A443SSN6_9ACAR|nr:protein FAM45A-like isoform X1 [Leptotrombidium deliense]